MINTEINGNSKSISSKGLFRDNKLIPSSNWFAGKESADVIEGSGFMYDHLYVEWRKPDYIGSRVQNLHAHLPF